MVCEDTLRIKYFPKELSDAEKEDFLKHFGAKKVKIITSINKQKSVVFAKFESKEIAKSVLFKLHQLEFLNSRLCVEYADHEIGHFKPKCKEFQETDNKQKDFLNNFITKINAFNSNVNFNQPPPANLRYVYPKANMSTIKNIATVLATAPKFYTQVLHLMNRMNFPPPFVIENPAQIPQQVLTKPPPSIQQEINRPNLPMKREKPSSSSSESELESDDESNKIKDIIPQTSILKKKKGLKRPKFIKPNVAQTGISSKTAEKAEDVFEKTNVTIQRKIELKVSSDSLERKTIPYQDDNSKVTMNPDEDKECAESSQTNETKNIITDEELKTNQIPLKDLGVLPVFKNYHSGAPSCRLYIKNIAKNVELSDLEYIYHRYKVEGKEIENQFEIRLMQEGRMKGQAFITFDTLELAQKALTETNGFILKDKPLVVVFAKSVVTKSK